MPDGTSRTATFLGDALAALGGGLLGHILVQKGDRWKLHPDFIKQHAPHEFLKGKRGLEEQWSVVVSGLSGTEQDILLHEFMPRLSEPQQADVIIHAAGYGQPTKFMADQIATLRLNTSVVMDLDHYLVPGGRALFISSSEVYSGNTWTPHTESMIGTTDPQHPRGAYIEGKRCGEAIAAALNSAEKTYKIARVSLSYGPGTRTNDDRVLYQFIGQALTSGVIQPKDGGWARRTYNYVSDAVEMIFNVLLRGKHLVYNIGGPSTVTIRDLATLIALGTGAHAMFPESTGQADASAPAAVRSSIDRYMIEFGKTDFVDIEEGLRRTIEWQKLIYA